MAAPTDVPVIIATADITLVSGSANKKVPESTVLVNGYGAEALPLNDINYLFNNHGLWLTYIKDEVIPSIDVTNWNDTSDLLATASSITPTGTHPSDLQNFQAIVEQGAGRSVKTINNGTSGVNIKVTYPNGQEAPQSYYDGLTLVVDAGGNFSGGANCTLELDSLGAKNLYSKYCSAVNNSDLLINMGVFNYPTEVYYDIGEDAFIATKTIEDRNLLYDEAIDIVPYRSLVIKLLGAALDITVTYDDAGATNYGVLQHSTINYSAMFSVGDIITVSGLQVFVTLGGSTWPLSGIYQIESFISGGLGMRLQSPTATSVETVTGNWLQVAASTNLNTSTGTYAVLGSGTETLPYGLSWSHFEKLEVLTSGETTPNLVSNLGVVPRELMVAYPTTFEIKVFTSTGNSAGIIATGTNTFNVTQDNDTLVSVKGYLRRSFA